MPAEKKLYLYNKSVGQCEIYDYDDHNNSHSNNGKADIVTIITTSNNSSEISLCSWDYYMLVHLILISAIDLPTDVTLLIVCGWRGE